MKSKIIRDNRNFFEQKEEDYYKLATVAIMQYALIVALNHEEIKSITKIKTFIDKHNNYS